MQILEKTLLSSIWYKLGKRAAAPRATLGRHSHSREEGLWWRGLDSKWAGHRKVMILLCILKRAGDRASGGGEGIYSTVIEKGRLMCKYKGHMGWGLVIEKRRCF
uniref:Uncharacterized protein n=1 Tax=Equus asinus asinus TaxID=83772 RepID=A0A8C4LU24_EQUAS